jgi:hypothetical protein
MVVTVDPIEEHGPDAGATAQARRVSSRTGGRWCHLMVDAGDDLESLHEFAARLGLKRSWAQLHSRVFPHYDLTPSKRALAVRLGAVEVGALEQARRAWRGSGENPIPVEQGVLP